MDVRIFAVGDVVSGGLDFLEARLPVLKRALGADFTVVNGENASGTGILPRQADRIFDAGADVITLGNHTWGRKEIETYLDDTPRIIRPANYAPQVPGSGFCETETAFGTVCVINLIGRCGMSFGPDSPFAAADRILKKTEARIRLVDFHAEATSEKLAMAYYLDGRATALWGTHTHVQTSDAQVFPSGLGYITDLGMTGAIRSVLGVTPESSLNMFLGNPPRRYEAAKGPYKLEGCLFTCDGATGRCLAAEAIRIE